MMILEVQLYLWFPAATFWSRTGVYAGIHKLSVSPFHREPIRLAHNTGKSCRIPSLDFQLS